MYDTEEKILGYPCKIIEYQTKVFWNRYYVATDFKIAPGTYKNHLSYNWSFYGEKSEGGLILKLEHRFKKYTMKGIAIEVKERGENFKALQIDEKLFSENCK